MTDEIERLRAENTHLREALAVIRAMPDTAPQALARCRGYARFALKADDGAAPSAPGSWRKAGGILEGITFESDSRIPTYDELAALLETARAEVQQLTDDYAALNAELS